MTARHPLHRRRHLPRRRGRLLPHVQSYDGDMAPPSSAGGGDDGQRRERDGKPKKKKDRGCPEGMVTLDDGSCAPTR